MSSDRNIMMIYHVKYTSLGLNVHIFVLCIGGGVSWCESICTSACYK